MLFPGDKMPQDSTCPNNIITDGQLTVPVHIFKSHLLSISNLYHPQVNDIIIVRAMHITGDVIKCLVIGPDDNMKHKQSLYCHLLSLSFYNVTKRNKPKIEQKELLLVRIIKITGSFVLVSAKEEWLGQINKLIEKYEQLTEETIDDQPSIDKKHKLLLHLSPMATMNIFMTGLEIKNTFVCLGMNGSVFLWGKKVVEVKEKLIDQYGQIK